MKLISFSFYALYLISFHQVTGLFFTNTLNKSSTNLLEAYERVLVLTYKNVPNSNRDLYYLFDEFKELKKNLFEANQKYKYKPHIKLAMSVLYDLKAKQVKSSKLHTDYISKHIQSMKSALNKLIYTTHWNFDPTQSNFDNVSEDSKERAINLLAQWLEKKIEQTESPPIAEQPTANPPTGNPPTGNPPTTNPPTRNPFGNNPIFGNQNQNPIDRENA
ncbi:hypothetical protein Kpol_298p5 [Vanderwaltozyma polyspora DSM 70294]|uniref:Uncharacterized protein n=1 Tax=Vanderwaltozyma polyspora (strain ATCC 22028 / DSM 70294 / BCRC 21397 / CBS 2163 / NBRC 10782 / NRRL Y-8283 / UCD 57-17) TaxID=436907 RepID=A7TT58_VANPO|nr:uncharacterized protein Kpol_298p5 [Vanderwaltozyma polyspora DSM 70294]EDO14553.1 hypothetical protein Kpol_298p5 [Vanderwaltozyma polyspora DSM 70294]